MEALVEALTDGDWLIEGEAEREAEVLTEGLAEADGLSERLTEGEAEAEGLSDALTDWLTEAEPLPPWMTGSTRPVRVLCHIPSRMIHSLATFAYPFDCLSAPE